MKKYTLLLCCFIVQSMFGSFSQFVEKDIKTNRFLSAYVGDTCPASSANTNETNCGNDFVNDVIGVNFLTGAMFTQGTYIVYNLFPYYVDEMSKALNNTSPPGYEPSSDSTDDEISSWADSVNNALGVNTSSSTSEEDDDSAVTAQSLAAGNSTNPEDYPAVGIYQLEISTASAVQDEVAVAPGLNESDNVDGAVKLVVRLRYNGGQTYSQDTTAGIYLLSQDAIYLQSTDSFQIVVSSEQDTETLNNLTSAASDSDSTVQSLLNYFQYTELTTADFTAYASATESPRMVRLYKF